jgi:hypothetical protein
MAKLVACLATDIGWGFDSCLKSETITLKMKSEIVEFNSRYLGFELNVG